MDNGKAVTFIMVAVDNGATKHDTFSLALSDGYCNTGTLLDGMILLDWAVRSHITGGALGPPEGS